MATMKRIESLQKRHADIDREILTLQSRPAQDETLLHQLKREKLLLKDEIARLSEDEAIQAA